ncbi:hypothetical protein ACWY2R_07760 [Enterococcus avium]
MKGRKRKYLFLISTMILGILVLAPIDGSASSLETDVRITFAEGGPTEPSEPEPGDTELPLTGPINRKQSGFGSGYGSSNKRLPQTGDHFQDVFSKLGYFALLMFLICAFSRKKEAAKADENKT